MTDEPLQPPVEHTPVLAVEVLELLAPRPGDVVVDATVGAGGHSARLGAAIGPSGRIIGLDADADSLAVARARLAGCSCPVSLHQRNFEALSDVLAEEGVSVVDVLLADLGVSSMQLADPARGFSFNTEGPLDMRMDRSLPKCAADLVNSLREGQISDLIWKYSQERFSRRIAQRICTVRREVRITTTGQLVDVICRAMGVSPHSRAEKIHPATRTFQALRIAVNDELGALERLLEQAPGVLKPGGRFGVIAFHSLEDGLVKRDFRRRKDEGTYELVNKRPVIAGEEERRSNPRSRSTKLRVARRTEPAE